MRYLASVSIAGKPKHRIRYTPELGELIELCYPEVATKQLADALGISTRQLFNAAMRRGIKKAFGFGTSRRPLGYQRTHLKYLETKISHDGPKNQRFAFAHVLAWEEKNGRKKRADEVIVFLDGDRTNLSEKNLYCMPKAQLLGWMRFIRYPVEVHVHRLWSKIMALDSSDAVKQKLLDVLDQIVDPEKQPDLIRQRAVCETVQTLVGLLRVEVAYLQAIEGDGKIPFLEPSRQRAVEEKNASRNRRQLAGPSPSHPWRGLGANAE